MKDESFKREFCPGSLLPTRRKQWCEFAYANRPKHPSLFERIIIDMYTQEYVNIDKIDLLNTVQKMKNEQYRLAQICVTKLEQFAFLYSFEKDHRLVNLCFNTGFSEPVASVGWLYPYAYLYENEMKDLFGVNVTDMNFDFKGNLYKTSIKTPFNPMESGEKAK